MNPITSNRRLLLIDEVCCEQLRLLYENLLHKYPGLENPKQQNILQKFSEIRSKNLLVLHFYHKQHYI